LTIGSAIRSTRAEMKQFWLLVALMMGLLLGMWALAVHLELPLATDPSPWLSDGGWLEALIGVGLLVIDSLLPIPSSLVMIAHGALFGIALGSCLSMIGSLLGAWVGFWIGRRGGPLMARLVPQADRERANRMFDDWGDLAIVVSRPLPVVAETLVIVAGTTSMGWRRLTAATLFGSLPASLLYALTGATAADLDSALLVFGLVMLVAVVFWLVGKRFRS